MDIGQKDTPNLCANHQEKDATSFQNSIICQARLFDHENGND
jgi:hypothetical protein